MVKVAFGGVLLCLACVQAGNVPTRPVGDPGSLVARAPSPSRAAERDEVAPDEPLVVRPGGYKMADLPVFSKVLFYVRENYYDKTRLDARRMLLGALQFVQRDVPEIVVEPLPIERPDRVVVTVSGESRTFRIDRVDQPWSLRSALQRILRFAQARLQPVSEGEEGQRLLEIETVATNGMLYTLDPHSVLIDAATYADMRGASIQSGSVGIVAEYDTRRRIRVIRLLPGAPAERAGVRPGDRVIRINEEPTAGLTLEDAFGRLRGEIGSGLDLYIERDGVRGLQRIHMERARLSSRSLDSGPRILTTVAAGAVPAAKIGYFHLAHLGADAGGAVEDALREFAREHVGGIVVDIRGNAGGLYAQAVRVADAFIKRGNLVSMVGVNLSQRKNEAATDAGSEPEVPLAVLVDHDTASGAEIVAAALHNLGRAIVLGQQTFGEGSVQVLFDVPSPLARMDDGGTPSKLGLKLTTAQFLTTADMPIQLRGVAPDVELRAVTVGRIGQRNVFQMEPRPAKHSEAAYEWSLAPSGAQVAPAHAAMTVDYVVTPEDEPTFKNATYSGDDSAATLAAEILAYAGQPRRPSGGAVAGLVGILKAREDARITAAIAALKTDWRNGPQARAPRLSLKIEPIGGGTVRAGTQVQLRGTVTNTGTTPAFRLRAVLSSDDPVFEGLEMPFGLVPPGEAKMFDLVVPIRPVAFARTDTVRGRLRDDLGDVLPSAAAETTVDIEGRPSPTSELSFTCQAIETARRPGASGRASVKLVMQMKNQGKGAAEDAEATVRSMGDAAREGLVMRVSRWSGAIAAGAKKEAAFVVELPDDARGGPVDLELSLGDGTSEQTVRARMRIDRRRPAGDGRATDSSWQIMPPTVSATPPHLTVNAPTIASSGTARVTGDVTADTAVRDVFIRVWNRNLQVPVRKVFYRKAAADTVRLPFEADIPLWAGSNIITVHARDTNGTEASRTMAVLKRASGPASAR
jgi:carboxyl-terminal processing protease